MALSKGSSADYEKGMVWLKDAAARGHIMAQRTLLGIEYGNSRHGFQKLIVIGKIAALAVRGGKKMFQDPDADILR